MCAFGIAGEPAHETLTAFWIAAEPRVPPILVTHAPRLALLTRQGRDRCGLQWSMRVCPSRLWLQRSHRIGHQQTGTSGIPGVVALHDYRIVSESNRVAAVTMPG